MNVAIERPRGSGDGAKPHDVHALFRFFLTGLGFAAFGLVIGGFFGCALPEDDSFVPTRNHPPTILMTSPPTIGIVRVDTGGVFADAGTSSVEFEFVVYDPNIGQALQAQLFVNNAATGFFRTIPPGRAARRDPVTIASLPIPTVLRYGCNKVELFVSSGFDSEREPTQPDDVATAVWWVAVSDPDHPVTINVRECP